MKPLPHAPAPCCTGNCRQGRDCPRFPRPRRLEPVEIFMLALIVIGLAVELAIIFATPAAG